MRLLCARLPGARTKETLFMYLTSRPGHFSCAYHFRPGQLNGCLSSGRLFGTFSTIRMCRFSAVFQDMYIEIGPIMACRLKK